MPARRVPIAKSRPPMRRLVNKATILHDIEVKQLQKVGYTTQARLNTLYKQAIATLQSSLDIKAVAGALDAGKIIAGLDWSTFGTQLFNALNETLGKTASTTAWKAWEDATSLSPDAPIKAAFKGFDQAAVDWAHQNAGKMIVDISKELQGEIRTIVADTLTGTRNMDATAALIRQSIGLTARQSGWVTAGFDANVADGLKAGLTLEDAQKEAQAIADKFSKRLLDQRAQTIARTELAKASVQGRLAGYEKMFSTGVLDQDQATQSWSGDADPCPICQANVDQGSIPYGTAFDSGDIAPPAHPNCECDILVNAPAGAYDLSSLS